MYTDINLIKVNQIIQELRRLEQILMREYVSLSEVIFNLRRIEEQGMKISARKLETQKSNLYSQIRKVQSLRITLEKIIQLYQKTENSISDYEYNRVFPGGIIINPSWISVVLKNMNKALLDANIRFE